MPTTTDDQTNLPRGYMIAFLSAVILSTTAIFIRHLTVTYQMPPLVLAFWRDSFVTLTLLPILLLIRPALVRIESRHFGFLVLYGLGLAFFNALWTLSVAINGAAVATVLAYSSAGFTALLAWQLLKERLGWAKLLAVALSLGGCLLVSGAYTLADWQTNLLGIVTGVLSGLLYAVYTLMGRAGAQRGLNTWTTVLYTFGWAAVFLLGFNLLPGDWLPGAARQPADFFWLGSSLAGWGMLFMLAAGPTVAGFGLYNLSLSYLQSSVANLIVTLEPAFTAVIAYFLFQESLSGVQMAGSGMILAGVVFFRIYDGWQTRANGLRARYSGQASEPNQVEG